MDFDCVKSRIPTPIVNIRITSPNSSTSTQLLFLIVAENKCKKINADPVEFDLVFLTCITETREIESCSDCVFEFGFCTVSFLLCRVLWFLGLFADLDLLSREIVFAMQRAEKVVLICYVEKVERVVFEKTFLIALVIIGS